MQIICPKCKEAQEVDSKTSTCSNCRTVLRRCNDCEHYDRRLSFCVTHNQPIDTADASYPTYSSDSTYCRDYAPNEQTRPVG